MQQLYNLWSESHHTAINDEYRSYIQQRLDDIEQSKSVKILLAIESGSRAWGFASPDSDFDVRFLYRHNKDWYFSIIEQKDVIEYGVDDRDVDLSGWDLRKALRLLLKSNPALYEWVVSPITYREDVSFRQEMRCMFERHADRAALLHHYHNLARTQWKRAIEGRSEIKLKKYFYVIRPLLSLIWLREKNSIPPMNIQELMQGVKLNEDVVSAIHDLHEIKCLSKESASGKHIQRIDDWVKFVLENSSIVDKKIDAVEKKVALEDVNRFFRNMIIY